MCDADDPALITESAFLEFPLLRTERLVLRQLRVEDANDIFAIKSDISVTVPYCVGPYWKLEQAKAWIELVQKGYFSRDNILWAITLKGEDKMIGDCTLWHLDHESGCGELGYELAKTHWGKGIAFEATSAVMNFGFSVMNLNRTEACPFSTNDPSIKLLGRLGFLLEGTLRQRIHFRGRYYDQMYYGLLKDEWEEQQKHRKVQSLNEK